MNRYLLHEHYTLSQTQSDIVDCGWSNSEMLRTTSHTGMVCEITEKKEPLMSEKYRNKWICAYNLSGEFPLGRRSWLWDAQRVEGPLTGLLRWVLWSKIINDRNYNPYVRRWVAFRAAMFRVVHGQFASRSVFEDGSMAYCVDSLSPYHSARNRILIRSLLRWPYRYLYRPYVLAHAIPSPWIFAMLILNHTGVWEIRWKGRKGVYCACILLRSNTASLHMVTW